MIVIVFSLILEEMLENAAVFVRRLPFDPAPFLPHDEGKLIIICYKVNKCSQTSIRQGAWRVDESSGALPLKSQEPKDQFQQRHSAFDLY